MEIKNVEEELKKEYPTQDEVSNTKLKKSIPKKWKKIGITALTLFIICSAINIYSIIFNVGGGYVLQPPVLMNHQARDQFNQKFLEYEGNQVTGSNVKTLIAKVISQNIQMEEEGTPEIYVSIKANNHIYKDKAQLEELRQTIVSGAKYKITVQINYHHKNRDMDGLVDEISIEKIDNTQ